MRFGDRVRVEMLDANGASDLRCDRPADRVARRVARGRARRDPDAQGRPDAGGEGRGGRRGAGRPSRRSSPTSTTEATRPSVATRSRSTAGRRRASGLTDEEIAACVAAVPEQTLDDIRFAQEQIRGFALAQRAALTDVEVETLPGRVPRPPEHPGRERGLLRARRPLPDGRLGAHERRHGKGRRRAARRRVRAARSAGRRTRRSSPRCTSAAPTRSSCSAASRRSRRWRSGPRPSSPSTCSSARGTRTSQRRSASSSDGWGSTFSQGRPRRWSSPTRPATPSSRRSTCSARRSTVRPAPQSCSPRRRELAAAVPAAIEAELGWLPTADVARTAWEECGEIILCDTVDELVDGGRPHRERARPGDDTRPAGVPRADAQLRRALPRAEDERRLRRQGDRHEPHAARRCGPPGTRAVSGSGSS